MPNPQAGPAFTFALWASRPASGVTLLLYAPSMVLARRVEAAPGPAVPWQALTFELPDLANGPYYYRLEAQDGQGGKAVSRVGRLYVEK